MVGGAAGVQYLRRGDGDALGDPGLVDPAVRGAVCDVLAQLGDTAALPRLTPLLADPDSKVVDRANRSIQKLRRGGDATTPAP